MMRLPESLLEIGVGGLLVFVEEFVGWHVRLSGGALLRFYLHTAVTLSGVERWHTLV